LVSTYSDQKTIGGAVLAWQDEPAALLGLDLHTGTPRWQLPMPTEREPMVVLGGSLALLSRTVGVTAVDATGHPRWTKRMCVPGVLQIFDDRVGVTLCAQMPPEQRRPRIPQLTFSQRWAVALDLLTGEESWRVPLGVDGTVLGASDGLIWVSRGELTSRSAATAMSALDPRTGKVLRSFAAPAPPFVPDRLNILSGMRDVGVFSGQDLGAVNLTDGQVLWRQAAPQRFQWPTISADRLLAGQGNLVREIDPRSGRDVASWELPSALSPSDMPMVRPASGGGVLVIKSRMGEPPLALHFAGPGGAAQLAIVPDVRPLSDDVRVVEDGVVMVSKRGPRPSLEGYAAFETIGSEVGTARR
jgi:hypothetical protein